MKSIIFILTTTLLNFVYADCGFVQTVPAINYIVSDNNSTAQSTTTITRLKDEGNPCNNYFEAFTVGWAGNYNRRATNLSNGNFINYNIYKNSNSTGILKGVNDITSPNEVFFGTIVRNQVITNTYYFTLAPFGTNVPVAGTYFDNIQVQAYSGTYTNINRFEGYKDLYIYIVVAPTTSISLVDKGGSYDPNQTTKILNFGNLTTGSELDFDIEVVSNAGYILSLSSSNNGTLTRTGGNGTSSQINYNFYANGNVINLTNSSSVPVKIASGTGVTPSQGVRIPARVIIGNVDNTKDPGTYQDYITLTTSTN